MRARHKGSRIGPPYDAAPKCLLRLEAVARWGRVGHVVTSGPVRRPGCASYVIADRDEAAVVDPTWEIADYLRLADEHGFQTTHVLETHNHADHLSGRGRLAAATPATIHISEDARVEYEHEPLADDDFVEVGRARIRTFATPRSPARAHGVRNHGREPR